MAKTLGPAIASRTRSKYPITGSQQPPRSTKYKGKKVKTVSIEGDNGKTFSKFMSGVPKKLFPEHPQMMNYFVGKGSLATLETLQEFEIAEQLLTSPELEQWAGNDPDFSLSSLNDARGKIYVEDMYGSIYFRNHYTTQCKVTLYDCVMKKNSTRSPLSLIRDGVTTRFNLNPVLQNGRHASCIGLGPTFSEYFNTNCKVLAAKNLILDPGQIHEHSYKYVINKSFAVADYFQELNNATTPWIGGWTRFTLIRLHGMPVQGSDGGETVTISPAKLVWTTNQRVNYKIVYSKKEKSGAYSTIAPVGGALRTINTESDAVQTIVDV